MVRKWIKSTLCATVGAITLIFATPQQSQAQANLEIVFIDSLWGGGIGAVSGPVSYTHLTQPTKRIV